MSLANLIKKFDFGTLAFKFTGKYSDDWKSEDSKRATYLALTPTTSQEADEYLYHRIYNDINLSSGVNFNLTGDNYHVYSNTLLLRQTQNDNVSTEGVRTDYRNFTITKSYSWREREFNMQQFVGDYSLDAKFPTVFTGALLLPKQHWIHPTLVSINFSVAQSMMV